MPRRLGEDPFVHPVPQGVQGHGLRRRRPGQGPGGAVPREGPRGVRRQFDGVRGLQMEDPDQRELQVRGVLRVGSPVQRACDEGLGRSTRGLHPGPSERD